MSGKSASEIAYEAAEAMRALNYSTLPHEGYPGLEGPADVYDVIGGLLTLTQREEQAVRQIRQWLDDQHEAGKIAHASGADPRGDVQATRLALGRAWDALAKAAEWLDVAHNRGSGLKAARAEP